jgi:outer membrane protein assembly factor BamB
MPSTIPRGAIRWSQPLAGTYYWSGLAYDQRRVFAVTFGGLLRAFNADSGALEWSAQLQGQYSFSSPPTATRGIVYDGGAGSGGTIYATSERTGALVWTQSVANGDHSSPAVDSHHIYVTYPDNYYAFDRLLGTPAWLTALGGDGGGGRTSVVARGHVYVRDWTTTGRILSTADGSTQGTLPSSTAPAIAGGIAYEMVDSTLTAFNRNGMGKQLWAFAGDGHLDTAPIVVGDKVWIGSSLGELYGLNRIAGPRRSYWSTNVGSDIPGPDEQNVSQPLSGLGANRTSLIVPAGPTLIDYRSR